MAAPDPGNYDTRFVIESRTTTRSNGEDVTTWTTAAQRWGQYVPLSGREYLQSQQVQAAASVRIRLRYYAGLTTTHRLRDGSRVFDINHIGDFRREDRMELMCTEAV